MVRGEREDLAKLLAGFTPDQWSHDTLCADWRVREVAAHVISYDDLTVFRSPKRYVVHARCNIDRFNSLGINSYAPMPTSELIRLIRRRAQPRVSFVKCFGPTVARDPPTFPVEGTNRGGGSDRECRRRVDRECRHHIGDFKHEHNHRRRHSALGYQTPASYAAACTHQRRTRR